MIHDSRSAKLVLELVALICLLGAVSLWLLQLIQPTQIVMLARVERSDRVQMRFDAGTEYIPFYKFKPAQARARASDSLQELVFSLTNEQTQSLQFMLGAQPNRIEIQSITAQGILQRVKVSAAQIADQFPIKSATVQAADGILVLQTLPNATIDVTKDFLQEMRALEQRETWLVITLLFVGIGALGIRVYLARPHRKPSAPVAQWVRGQNGRRPQHWLTLLFLVYGSARILQLVLHDPMVGLANNGDFYRLQACFGWSSTAPRDAAGFEIFTSSISKYIPGQTPVHEICYLSSQALFVGAVDAFARWSGITAAPGGTLDLRVVGFLSGLFLIFIGVALTLLLTRVSSVWGFCSAVVFALLFADPMNTVYLNTLFAEFSGIAFLYLAVGLMTYAIASAGWHPALSFALGATLFLLSLSKLQTLLLPFALLAVFLFVLWRIGGFTPSRVRVGIGIAILVGASLAGLGLQRIQMERSGYMHAIQYVNRFDTYFGAVLPAMQSPTGGMKQLNLPDECAKYIGMTWYDTHEPGVPCRDGLDEITAPRTLSLFIQDPALLPRLVQTAIPRTRGWLNLEDTGIPDGTVAQIRVSPFWTLAWFVDPMPLNLYWAIVFISGIGSLLAFFLLLAPPVPNGLKQLAGIQLLLTAIVLYVFFTALFGDGYLDFSKHTYLLRVPLLLSCSITPILSGWSMLVAKKLATNKSMPAPSKKAT